MENRTQELVNQLPYAVHDKLVYYLNYVDARLADVVVEEKAPDKLLKQIRSEVEFMFLLRWLYGYFVVGFQNYERTLDYFENKKVNGFKIGSGTFNKQSPLTSQWERVANDFERLVRQPEVARYVLPKTSMDTVLRQIVRSISDASKE